MVRIKAPENGLIKNCVKKAPIYSAIPPGLERKFIK
jgi:hypothetical protein